MHYVRSPWRRWLAVDTAQSQGNDQGKFVHMRDQGAPMTVAASQDLSFATLLKLGRVSNLPTVWTNVLAGTVLAGGEWGSARFGLVLIAMSLFYIGGMYLNDYFDRAVDARERPTRPIPAGEISAAAVATTGAALLACAVALMAAAGTTALATGVLLTLFIVSYDAHHKEVVWAPVVMGACRALVYCGAAAAAVGTISAGVLFPALACGLYVAGITYAASRESIDKIASLWPLVLLAAPLLPASAALARGPVAGVSYLALVVWLGCAVYLIVKRPAGAVSRAVGWLIAGISLVDAAFVAGAGAIGAACWALAGFAATLMLHKQIAGT
jgi:UbiA prenyltransferase family